MLTKEVVLPAAKEQREALFLHLYQEAFPNVARYVSRMGGSLEEARDVFQDAVIAYYEKTTEGDFAPENGEKAYLLGIARFLWLKRYRDRSGETPLDEQIKETSFSEGHKPDSMKLMQYLATAGKKCMDLLKSFYYHRSSMREIADEFGFTSERSATVQKYKCLEKVRTTMKEKSMNYEDFLA